jgi:ADP-ribosylglycohydrolase
VIRKDDEPWYLVLMIGEILPLPIVFQNQQVFVLEENSHISGNITHSPPFQLAI